jgi:hypothetical protein
MGARVWNNTHLIFPIKSKHGVVCQCGEAVAQGANSAYRAVLIKGSPSSRAWGRPGLATLLEAGV